MNSTIVRRVFIARLVGTTVFDPLGDPVGRIRDAVVILGLRTPSRVVGMVIEVPGRRRVFLPIRRLTAINQGQVIITGLLNLRRFEQRSTETLVMGDLLEREVELLDGSKARVEDIAIEQQRNREWFVTKAYLRSVETQRGPLGFTRRGEAKIYDMNEVKRLSRSDDAQSAKLLLSAYEDLKPADMARVISELSTKRKREVADALTVPELADILAELHVDDQREITLGLSLVRAAEVLDQMDPDDATDLIAELPEEHAESILATMNPDEAKDIKRLLEYEDNTAGGIMTSEPVIVAPETPVAHALADIRREDLTPALASTVFVTRPPNETPTGKLLGIVHFQQLLRTPPHSSVGSIMEQDYIFVGPEEGLPAITRELAQYNLVTLPVVDEERNLLGAISVDDVLDHLLPEDWRDEEEVYRG